MSMEETPAPAPDGLKAKAQQAALKAYLKAPPPVQKASLNAFMKAQPVIAKVQPHTKKVVGAAVGLLAVRKLRHRSKD